MLPSTLTRAQFDDACKAFVKKYASEHPKAKGLKGWSWVEHPSVLSLGYLSRTVLFVQRGVPLNGINVEDQELSRDEIITTQAIQVLTYCQNIVYSASFQVPALYFTVNDASGSPLPFEDMIRTTMSPSFPLEDTEATAFSMSFPNASFPLLSYGDHPTTGQPSWYFHPCHTSDAVGELMSELEDGENDTVLVRWLEVWCMVVGTVLDWVE